MHIQEEKQQLRLSIKERIARMTPTALAAEGRSITRRILQALPSAPVTICVYYSLTDEANISSLIPELFKRGDHVYLPRFLNATLTFKHISELKGLTRGALGIPEAPESAEELDPKKADIVLVPGRAFDEHGYRLGRGNGGYDKWIQQQRLIHPFTQFWGIALECQMVKNVPVEPHDEKMHRVMTERGVLDITQ